VFIGEAPGGSENICGEPFVGPAGIHLQKYVIQKAIPHNRLVDPTTKRERWVPTGPIKYILTNLVGCIPLDDTGRKEGAPDHEDILQCAPRLLELLAIVKPKLIVCVGHESTIAMDTWMKNSVWSKWAGSSKHPSYDVPRVTITHPAEIIRQNIANQGLRFQECALIIEQAIEEYVLNPDPPKRHSTEDIPF
jgi:uracil-DNA glycosylase